MLTLKHITKIYTNKKNKSKDLTALEDINITFPKQGFVSILGPSGCGKTTLLNILGGLDTNYSGEFIVNNVNTKTFKKSDWDAYRNNHVGFVFQEYNLIPHQSVSKNVELVLTIAGAPKIQTKENSKNVLKNVGLEEKLNENPNNLSGGQKQRVAIARAIVNDPELILADEPTSALDTKTSEQVMDILKKISKKKLVIMVTHNVELAKKYSSRIINLLDGKITLDEKFEEDEEKDEFLKKLPQSYKYGKSKMKFITAAELSLKNLASKKRRTFLTALAGSVGIVCLAIILGISNGATTYVTELNKVVQRKRPIVISNYQNINYYSYDENTEVSSEESSSKANKSSQSKSSSKSSDSEEIKNPSKSNNFEKRNSLKKNKKDPEKDKYYKLTPEIADFIKAYMEKFPDIVKAIKVEDSLIPNIILKDNTGNFSRIDHYYFQEIPYSKSLESCFSLVGNGSRWPTKKEEVVIVLDDENNWSNSWIKYLGLENKKSFSASDFIGKEIAIIPTHNDYYRFDEKENIYFKPKKEELSAIASNPNSIHLTCVGIIKPTKDFYQNEATLSRIDRYFPNLYPLSAGVAYTKELGEFIKKNIENSNIVKDQQTKNYNVLKSSGINEHRIIDENQKKHILQELGIFKNPEKIIIYLKDPEKNKKAFLEYLNSYSDKDQNKRQLYISQESAIENTIKNINQVCLFLGLTIGLAALLSSLIMVALLTFISVLERIKEIGVLRSIGARKKDISRLFKSEALLIGLLTGFVGVSVGIVAQIIINSFISRMSHEASLRLVDINLPIALGLVCFSLVVTLFAALIPAKIASRKDPVKILTGSNN